MGVSCSRIPRPVFSAHPSWARDVRRAIIGDNVGGGEHRVSLIPCSIPTPCSLPRGQMVNVTLTCNGQVILYIQIQGNKKVNDGTCKS